jgi:hypothetical protein
VTNYLQEVLKEAEEGVGLKEARPVHLGTQQQVSGNVSRLGEFLHHDAQRTAGREQGAHVTGCSNGSGEETQSSS